MKIRDLPTIAGGSAALILCTSADAAYVGLSIVHEDDFFSNHPNTTVRDAWNAGPVNQLDLYRLYAVFDSNGLGDRVNSAAGAPGSPFVVTVSGGTFHNYAPDLGWGVRHYHLPLMEPVERAWDTYVTLGNAINGGSSAISPGFDVETNNLGYNSNVIGPTPNVGWFVTPTDPQGQAVSNAPGQAPAPPNQYRVLLAQFVVTEGSSEMFGNVVINVAGLDYLNQTFAIPAPAAVPLLIASALLTAAHRRRKQDDP